MTEENHVGLDKKSMTETNGHLATLLASYSILYQNVRGYHWKIKGKSFFELHERFEQLYQYLYESIDEIAERILTLGGLPEHNYSDYFTRALIKESKEQIVPDHNGVEDIINGLKVLLNLQREIVQIAEQHNDVGTSSLLSEFIIKQEKIIWMYTSYKS